MLNSFSKYRSLLISILLFILLDLSVLGLNFVLSYQITEDAKAINLAGRQRMLTQRITKNLLEFQSAHRDFEPYDHIVKDLNRTLNLFDSTFSAFDTGGLAPITESKSIKLKAIESEEGRLALEKAKPIWSIYKNYTLDLLNEFKGKEKTKADIVSTFKEEALFESAAGYASANSSKLQSLMNDLTHAVEDDANRSAKLLRIVLISGICLALLNFLFIIFHSLRQLRESDTKVEEAKQETDRILNTVEGGLFLLNSDYNIGEQYSAAMETIFSTTEISNRPFISLVSNAVDKQDLINAGHFIRLLFDNEKNHTLLTDLNPLKNVAIYVKNKKDNSDLKFLQFSFSPVVIEEHVEHVLVTVKDITEPSLLKKHLEDERRRSEQRMNIMTNVMSADAEVIPLFIENSMSGLNEINHLLKQTDIDDMAKINEISEIINKIKSEASTFKLDSFVDMSDEFNSIINNIKNRPDISGENFLELTVMLNQMMSNIEAACQLPNTSVSSEKETDKQEKDK